MLLFDIYVLMITPLNFYLLTLSVMYLIPLSIFFFFSNVEHIINMNLIKQGPL